MYINKMSIGQRLAVGFGVVIALLIMLASLAYTQIGSLNGEINLVVRERYPKTVFANKIKADLNEVTRNMLNVLIMTDAEQIKKELVNIQDKDKSMNEAIDHLARLITDEKGREHIKAIKEFRDKFLPNQAKFVALINEDKKDDAMVKLMFSVRPLQSKYFALLDSLIIHQHDQMEQAGDESTRAADRTRVLITVLALIAAALSV